MAQIFPRWTNRLPLLLGIGGVGALVAVVGIIWYWFSPSYTDVGYSPKQPVAFSHAQHAGQLGMDCRYCHNSVERAGHAAVPPTQTCMGCHQHVRKDSPKLALVRQSFQSGEAIKWKNVHMLPEYARFNHAPHLNAGVGCVSCHGRIDTMAVVGQQKPLSMSWCLDCHRDPTPNLRPRTEVTNMTWDAAKAGYAPGTDPHRKLGVAPPTHCSGCHY